MIVQTRTKELKKKVAKSVADPIQKLKIWILFPYLEKEDPNLQYYYDFSQSLEEYKKIFAELGADWSWQPVTMKNYQEVIAGIKKKSGRKIPLVLNLCDGDEINGTPGVSVIHELEQNRLIYTGSDKHFYTITTSKIPMKKAFDTAGVSTAKWEIIDGSEDSIKGICKVGSSFDHKARCFGRQYGCVGQKRGVYRSGINGSCE